MKVIENEWDVCGVRGWEMRENVDKRRVWEGKSLCKHGVSGTRRVGMSQAG